MQIWCLGVLTATPTFKGQSSLAPPPTQRPAAGPFCALDLFPLEGPGPHFRIVFGYPELEAVLLNSRQGRFLAQLQDD
jgi:hypothetical protein